MLSKPWIPRETVSFFSSLIIPREKYQQTEQQLPERGDFFGAKALAKMTHADRFSKQQMLCQSEDNFCVFATQERLRVTRDFNVRSQSLHVSSANVKVKRKEKVGGGREGKSKETRVPGNQPHPGRPRSILSDSAQRTCVITCFVDIRGSDLTCNQHFTNSCVLCNS